MHDTDASKKRQSILVVDDEEMLRLIFRVALERDGYVVSEASSGNEAWSKIAGRDFDVVISDVRMPDGDGLALLDQLQAKKERRPYLILVTGYCDISESDAMARGASAMFSKPSDLNCIRNKLHELLEPHHGSAPHG